MPRPATIDTRQPEAAAKGLRPEIQALRAFAVLAVVANHLAPGLLPGGYLGVDIFFVISGYLITSHLMRELDSTGRVRLLAFWGRRARRLLPASLLVLGFSLVGTVLLVPQTLWKAVIREITAAALYVENWILASDSQDYFASSASPSPVTHYWSLSLEEQFYLGWPVIAFLAFAIGHRRRRGRMAAFIAFALVVVGSLGYSIWYTDVAPSAAYFVTPARLWQLGLGGLLAFVPSLLRQRHGVAAVGWLALVGSVVVFDESSPVPGWITLIPVLGAVVVIWSGDAFLAKVPRQIRPGIEAGLWIGSISYSLYLWHWPMIVLAPYLLDRPLTPAIKLALLASMLVVAWLSTTLVENPVRRSRWLLAGKGWRTAVPALVAMALVVSGGQLALRQVGDQLQEIEEEIFEALESGKRCFGARAIAQDCERPYELTYKDSPLLRTGTYSDPGPAWGDACMNNDGEAILVACEFGVPKTEATLEIALIGDSHARHWFPAFDVLAVERKWNVTILGKSSCPPTTAPMRTRNMPELIPNCRTWTKLVDEWVKENDAVDLVVASGFSRNYIVEGIPDTKEQMPSPASQKAMERGYAEMWRGWADTGKQVVALADVPLMRLNDVPTCVATAKTTRDPCRRPTSRVLPPDPLLGAVERADHPDIHGIDMMRFLCDEKFCHSVVGGIVAYSDGNHMISYFVRSMAPYLGKELDPILKNA